ncbi:uncharacterized protein ANIA_11529 [Aspergillus nidulans FGSC A4]|uniref:Uncharacterized protein n=1 Tax=Emericella nidulans (strain FGSC A4 / ATCC 38163 / CBS 112.46 / NRRL 194 / M139) TaxID=227321 RepID=C8V292_EMENI|nr:hypothetical protein [Aspergillus nidulans FGSC A4]CBF71487.1 TPA: hypothetical protein ANIA_11529 [Aspergillus nidulans FGSC A4]
MTALEVEAETSWVMPGEKYSPPRWVDTDAAASQQDPRKASIQVV